MAKKIVIIGGGVAGLSTGCYARMNGYEAEIHESHTVPGGLCTTWKRGCYQFDGSLEWLVGTAAKSPFHAYWREVGALDGVPILDHEIFYQFLGRDGRRLCFYADADRLERHLVELSPADAEPAAHLCRMVKAFASRSLLPDKPMELMGPLDIARLIVGMLPVMKEMGYAQKTSVREFASRFKDPLTREGLQIALALPECSLLALVATLADFHNHAAGFPYGGSLELARRIEARYLALGGVVEYRSKVARIVVEDGRAVGVALAEGREIRADYVVSAADLRATTETLLNGAYPLLHAHGAELGDLTTVWNVNPLYEPGDRIPAINREVLHPVWDLFKFRTEGAAHRIISTSDVLNPSGIAPCPRPHSPLQSGHRQWSRRSWKMIPIARLKWVWPP